MVKIFHLIFFSREKLLGKKCKAFLLSETTQESETHLKFISSFISTEYPSDNRNSLKIILVKCFIVQSTSPNIS